MTDQNLVLPDPRLLARIEEEFWTAAPPDVSAVVRGAPINGDKFFAHAIRQAREYSLRGANMASISVLPGWPLEKILAEQLATYTRYATCPVSDLRQAGFEVLATGRRPHADVVLPSLTIVEAKRAVRRSRGPQPILAEEVSVAIELDIPCDVQGRDQDGHLWAFLDEATHPDEVAKGHLVVTGDETDPVVARVVDLLDRPGGVKVVMELVGDAGELLEALIRARVVAA